MACSLRTIGAEEGDGYVPEEGLSRGARSSRGRRRRPAPHSARRRRQARTSGVRERVPHQLGPNCPDPSSPDRLRRDNAAPEASAS